MESNREGMPFLRYNFVEFTLLLLNDYIVTTLANFLTYHQYM